MTDAADTPETLQAALKERLRWVCSIFGQPVDLLRILTVAEWRRLRAWVRGLEALAAQLVRALAAATPPPAETPRPKSPFRSGRIDPDTDYPDSERWTGVCFRLRDAAPADAPPRIAGRRFERACVPAREPCGEGFRSAHRLAVRLEAVIRVAENATRYAKRLARRQARLRGAPRSAALPEPSEPSAPSATAGAPPAPALGPPLRPPAAETG